MSIFASIFSIEDERQWIADLTADGIKAGVIRDGGPNFDDLDAPIIYQGSHVLPEMSDVRGGSVHLALIPKHIRFWLNNPDAPTSAEPDGPPPDPYLRLDVLAHETTYHGGGDATVILTLRQVARLRDSLTEWLEYFDVTGAERSPSAERTQARPEVDYSTWGAKGKGWR